MVDNRYATALVIGSVLSLLATVYLSVAVGTQHWYQYNSPPLKNEDINATQPPTQEDISREDDEKSFSQTMFRRNGTLGLWWRCFLVSSQSHWFKEPGKLVYINRLEYVLFVASKLNILKMYVCIRCILKTSLLFT